MMKRIITTNKNGKWILKKLGTYTVVDTGKKIFKLPFDLDKTIIFLNKMGVMK